jgi:hypothetical protein
MEVVVATVIAVIAVVALAYSFGSGRNLVNHYELARVALAAAQRRLELLGPLPATAAEFQVGRHPGSGTFDFQVDGHTLAHETWTVTAFDDPANGTGPPNHLDLRQVTVTVSWGRQSPAESVELTRLFPYR